MSSKGSFFSTAKSTRPQTKNSSVRRRLQAIDIVREMKGNVRIRREPQRRRFDISFQRRQEIQAAVFIQAWWRGIRSRRRYQRLRFKRSLKEAEERAKKAQMDYVRLKETTAKYY